MKTVTRRAFGLVALPTAGLGLALVLVPGRAQLVVHVYVLVVLGLTLGAVVGGISRAAGSAPPSAFEAALRRSEPAPERLGQLAKIERETTLAHVSAFDLHFRLRPELREVAAGLLASRRGVDLDGEPEQSRELLGDETWEVVRADREPPRERAAPGLDTAALTRVIDALESI
jgi:hypothetical protein